MTHKKYFQALPGLIALVFFCVLAAAPVRAVPYAEMVMDARTGEILRSRNADTRLHPASLTKMMTLYIAFEAVRLGEITMDTEVTISRNAANTPYAIGFRAGTTVQLRYLVRAAAVRSSNDAATAIAEAISGSEAAFIRRMNRTARALGMVRTTFRNPHGLDHPSHLSTANDMTIMGRRLFYDYNQYYGIFGRTSTPAGPIGTVYNTNRFVLNTYEGADGIKTGFTGDAGYNLVSSAQRGGVRVIATVFGGRSGATRNQRIMELLDMGFDRAPARATERIPALPVYEDGDEGGAQGRVIRMSGAVTSSMIPIPRPLPAAELPPELVAAIEDSVEDALVAALTPEAPAPEAELEPEIASVEPAQRPEDVDPDAEFVATIEDAVADVMPTALAALPDDLPPEMAAIEAPEIPAAPEFISVAQPEPETPPVSLTEDGVVILSADAVSATRPRPRPIDVTDVVARAAPLEPEIVTRSSSSGSRLFGVSLGRYATRNAAERQLLRMALSELGTFDTALRHVANRSGGFEAQFAGMTEEEASQACLRLVARNIECAAFGPS